jgi:hypothetical protein
MIDAAVAAPYRGSRGFIARPPAVAHHQHLRRGVAHRGLHRHGRFDRFAATGWGGYLGGFAEPIVLGERDGGRAEFPPLQSPFEVPVVVGIRGAPPGKPAIIVVGRQGKRLRRTSDARALPGAQDHRAGPLIISLATPGR